MSLGKLPGLKGRRRFRSELSVDMISSPLGDFRHTMHVGRGGDVFGDTSFLSRHGGPPAQESPPPSTSSTNTGFLTRTLRHVRRSPGRPRAGSRDLSSPPPPISPIIKNAVSLPQLSLDMSNGCMRGEPFPSSPEESAFTYGMHPAVVTLPRHLQDSDTDSIASFTVDLGPSLLSEVFAAIECSGWERAGHEALTEMEAEPLLQRKETKSTGQEQPEHRSAPQNSSSERAPYAYPEEEDEIKV